MFKILYQKDKNFSFKKALKLKQMYSYCIKNACMLFKLLKYYVPINYVFQAIK